MNNIEAQALCKQHLNQSVLVNWNDGREFQGVVTGYDNDNLYLAIPDDGTRSTETAVDAGGEYRRPPFMGGFGGFGGSPFMGGFGGSPFFGGFGGSPFFHPFFPGFHPFFHPFFPFFPFFPRRRFFHPFIFPFGGMLGLRPFPFI